MKISTRLSLAVFLPLSMALVIFIALGFSYLDMKTKQENGDTVRRIRSSITELNHVVFSYVLYHEERPKQQFLAEHEDLTKLIAGAQVRLPDQQRLLDSIREDNETMSDLFLQLVSSYERGNVAGTNELQGLDAQLVGLLLLKSYEADSDASLLRSLIDDDMRITELRTFGLILLVIVLVTIPITYSLTRTRRSIISSLSNLSKGASVIGSGNLDYAIPEEGKDEISDLCRAFNHMSASLKTVTASKTDLEREIAARNEAEEELLASNEQLQEKALELEAEIDERNKAEEAVKRYTAELETANRELAAANKELESFSYTVSHDLRAPLRSMDGYSKALQEDYSGILDEQAKQWLDRIRASSQQMGRLIDDILGLSRVIRAELKFEKVDLSEMAWSTAARLKEIEPKRQVEFVIVPGMEAAGDSNLLNLVLQNLLGNAFKFTSGIPKARIEFGVTRQEGRKVYFVRDNGAGFDMKYVDKLFKPFQRLHSDKEYPGTGIGLVTVQRIIQRHGGGVWAESEVNKGASFYFTLGPEKI